MANTVSGLFEQRVLPALHQLNSPIALANSMLRKIYVDPELGLESYGQTTNINVPTVNRANVINIGGGGIQPQDQVLTTVSLVVNKNQSNSKRITDWDRVRTPYAFKEAYMKPLLEELIQAVDLDACALVTSGNFPTYSSITGGADTFSRANASNAWGNLAGGGVPKGDLHFMTGHVPFSNMIADTSWIQESIVGINAAESAQQRAYLMPAFGAEVDWDPLFPQPSAGATYAGLFFHRNAIGMKVMKPPSSEGTAIEETFFTVPGTKIVFRVQFWYDPNQQAHILHAHCIYALGVVRPEYGSYLVST